MPRAGLFAELRRRHVWRVAAAYAIAAWLLVQIATQVFPFFEIPNWAVRLVVILVVVCFPVAMALAWLHEITPEGIRRTESPDVPEVRPELGRRQLRRKLDIFIAGALVVAVVVLGVRMLLEQRASSNRGPDVVQRDPGDATPGSAPEAATSGSGFARAIPAKSIAVLPFENLSDDKQNEYFVAGIQDLILTRLADIGDLKVISRTSTARYGSRPENLRDIALQLGVATILEGSVQKAGDRVLVNVKLIDARNDSHVWGQDYARKLDDIFGVEGEVAEKVAAALKAKLSPEESARLATVPTQNQTAYDWFLRAEYARNRGFTSFDSVSFKRAIAAYREAIEQDPGFALAWARLSQVESELAWFAGGTVTDLKQLVEQAREDAARALELSPDSAAAQLAAGYSDFYGRSDYEGAARAFSAVLALRPNDAEALAAQGRVQRKQARFEDSIASLERAFSHDPRNSAVARDIGQSYLVATRYAEAEAWLRRALTLDPDNLNAKTDLADAIIFSTGDTARALKIVEGDAPVVQLKRVELLTYRREYRRALELLDQIPDTPDNFEAASLKPLQLAKLHRLMGDTAKARQFYAQALPALRQRLKAEYDVWVALVSTYVADAALGLGRTAEGMEAITRSQAVIAASRDSMNVPNIMRIDAALYVRAGRHDLAVPLLAKALASPGVGGYYSPVLLWLDPEWDPIRGDPDFEALLKQYAKYKPAVA